MANHSTDRPYGNTDVRSLVSSHESISLGQASWVKTVRADAAITKYHSCERIGRFTSHKYPDDIEQSLLK
jgi:hypothetical protein